MKSVGQNVDQEAADELVGIERHELVAGVVFGPVILPFERHARAVEGEGLGGGFEQQVIDDRLVVIGDVSDRSGQGEDDMEIGYGQEFRVAVGQPLLGSGGRASV
jgi:hypothetical protein